jgi:tRNA 2-thiouridine synthesizing protein E
MPVRHYEGRAVEVTEEGFLTDSAQWTPEVAEAIAAEAGLPPLSERHWRVITFCREDAARQGAPPGLRRISRLLGVTTRELYALFPRGPGKLAARVAGLPKPDGWV